ncbi:Sugar or nucleoside kinase, ribokinase family [Flavimobilis marinus]|uniref:Sugar or nucleoside kinase, ribokinase family n=2 Tax=Flavimobilis marinus TaxID=285351 RepID=A0A1I2CY53_9MICO|nr:Sugar or nucleoside kinase, ribokinase family [Flavimobilis marinus]
MDCYNSPMTDSPRVLAVGLATLDVVQVVERLPGPDEKLVARSVDVDAGGPALNAARTAALLGCDVTLVTVVGAGAIGEAVRAGLGAVRLDDRATGAAGAAVSTVLVTAGTGERAVVSTNATGVVVQAEAPDLTGVCAVLVDGHHLDLALATAAEARRLGIPVLLDGGSWKPGLEALLAHVDVALLSADFRLPADLALPAAGAALSSGSLLADVARLGPTVVAQSHGAGAIEVLAHSRAATVPVPRAGRVVDTLGAGDVLHGALLACLAAGPRALGAVVVDALAVAAEVASASVAAPGALGWARDGANAGQLRCDAARFRSKCEVP